MSKRIRAGLYLAIRMMRKSAVNFARKTRGTARCFQTCVHERSMVANVQQSGTNNVGFVSEEACVHSRPAFLCGTCGDDDAKLCQHRRLAALCTECNEDGKLCMHSHERSSCRQCSNKCMHGRERSTCSSCVDTCEHGASRSMCRLCIRCVHGRSPMTCNDCSAIYSSLC